MKSFLSSDPRTLRGKPRGLTVSRKFPDHFRPPTNELWKFPIGQSSRGDGELIFTAKEQFGTELVDEAGPLMRTSAGQQRAINNGAGRSRGNNINLSLLDEANFPRALASFEQRESVRRANDAGLPERSPLTSQASPRILHW